MMRIACIVIMASLMLASAACATTLYTETMYIDNTLGIQGNNWIALRGVPLDPNPGAIFPDPAYADGYLFKLDPTTGGTEMWMQYSYEFKMLLGEGYWVQNPDVADYQIQYLGIDNGVPDGGGVMTDMWISLPGQDGANGGWHWIGNPFNHNILWLDIMVTDGTKTIPVLDIYGGECAYSLGWIDAYWPYLDGPTQGTMLVDPEGIIGSDSLEPGKMYQVLTFKSDIALIIPAY